MRYQSTIVTLVASIVIGALYCRAMILFWGYYAANNAFSGWLLETLAAQGHVTLYQAVIFAHDVLVSVVVSVPVAALFIVLRRLNHWRNPLVAAVAAVVFAYWNTNWEAVRELVTISGFWFGLLLTVASLPAAFAVLRVVQTRGFAVTGSGTGEPGR